MDLVGSFRREIYTNLTGRALFDFSVHRAEVRVTVRMPRVRITNNSVSSLEEQDIIIQTMADKANLPVKSSSISADKKPKKKKTVPSAARGSAQTEPAPPPQDPTEEEDIVAILESAEPGPQPGPSTVGGPGTGDGFVQQGIALQQPLVQPNPEGFPLPYFYPPQLYGRGFAQYPSMAQNFAFPDFSQAEAQSVHSEEWEAQSTTSSTARQPTHQISDEEDEALVPDVEAPKKDFASLKAGKVADVLKGRHEKVHGGDKLGEEINETLAGTVNDFYMETKVVAELDKLVKDYPRIKNIPKLRVAKLDVELFPAVDQNTRLTDVALQNLQKGLVGAVSAVCPVAALMVKRADTDPELEGLFTNMVDAIQMMTLVDQGLTTRRRELIKPSMQQTYAKTLAKGNDGSPEWLYGGNLTVEARKCEEAKKVAEKVMKRKQTQNAQPNQGAAQNKGAGRGQAKRFKFPQGNKQQHFLQRGYQSYQQGQGFPTPMPVYQPAYQQFQPQYQEYRQRNPRQGFQQQYGGQQQDFQKRGNKK